MATQKEFTEKLNAGPPAPADPGQLASKSLVVEARAISLPEGFSLIELLVTVAIIAVLAALIFGTSSAVLDNARKVESLSVMRNIGMALASYTGENNQLPGPLHGGQFPRYDNKPHQLITYLWPYFSETKPESNEMLPEYVPKHWRNWVNTSGRSSADSAVIYSMSSAYISNGRSGEPLTLWGYPTTGPEIPKSLWSLIAANVILSKSIALTDVSDANDPKRPKPREIQRHTTRLFLDWHADTVKQ